MSGEDDAGPSWWEQVWTRSAQIGAMGTVKMIVRKSIRPIVRCWKRWRVCLAVQDGLGTNEIVHVFARTGEDIDHLSERFRQKLRSSLPVARWPCSWQPGFRRTAPSPRLSSGNSDPARTTRLRWRRASPPTCGCRLVEWHAACAGRDCEPESARAMHSWSAGT